MLAVSDMDRSVAFYQKLFGPPVFQDDVAIFRIGQGPQFFGLTRVANGAKPDFLSYGLGVENFDPHRILTTLSDLGVKDAQVTDRAGTPELFLRDPNGVKLQLQDTNYLHGSGPRGDILPPAPRAAKRPTFQLRTLNHVTLTPNQGARSLEFYQKLFALPIRTRQGATVLLQVGSSPESVAFNTAFNDPQKPASINHCCYTIDNFDAKRVMGILIDYGMEPIEWGVPAYVKPMTCRVRLRERAQNGGGPSSPLGTPELYFNDPDNIEIQLQDVSYCGGSGWNGNICT